MQQHKHKTKESKEFYKYLICRTPAEKPRSHCNPSFSNILYPRNTPPVSCICRRRRRPLTSELRPTAMHCRHPGCYYSEKTSRTKTRTPQTTIAKSHGVEDLWSLEGWRRCWMTAPCFSLARHAKVCVVCWRAVRG